MFARLPKQLTSSFGLLGDDAKLTFCSGLNGIQKLGSTRNIAETDSYWEQYTTLFDSASDVFSLISPQDLRRALTSAPENVAMLVKVVSARLFQLLSDHSFPAPQTVVGRASSLISPISPGAAIVDSKTKEVLNCLRVLSRVLPAIFEVEVPEFEEQLLWTREVVDASNQAPDADTQFVIDDEDDEAEVGGAAQSRVQETLPSCAERLIATAVDLLFCCGFTLPIKVQVGHQKINHTIWEHGIGTTQDPGTSRELDMNKSEVLRFLLVLLSRQIYFTPTTVLLLEAKYTAQLVQRLPRRTVLTVLCSLLNTAMNSSRPGFQLPYNHLVWKGDDPREQLVSLSMQVLVAALDYQSANAHDVESADTQMPTAKSNAFRYFIAKLHRPVDLDFILTGIVGILDQFMGSLVNVLPGSRKPIPYLLETVVLLWKIIELNKKFKAHILTSERMSDVVAYLITLSLEMKDKPHHHGLCRALSYILQSLSAEPEFGQRLGGPVKVKVPAKWQTVGTTADFMINGIYTLVATTQGQLSALYPAMIIALSNCSPHLQNLSVTAAARLIQLLTSFANPQFLLADDSHPRLLFFMLETFNGILHHHAAENPNVLYAIVRSHKIFEDLGTFTLVSGLREIRRVQLAKEEQDKAKAARNPLEQQPSDAGIEKARLLRQEAASTDSVGSGEPPMSPTQFANSEPPSGRQSAEDVMLQEAEGQRQGRMSEKARGKMRERAQSIDDTTLERIAAAGIGRNGFVPTQEWVTSWQQGLPLDTIMLSISELRPKVLDIQARRGRSDIGPVLDFLRVVTLGHILPETPPLTPRRFQWSDASLIWLTSLIWGEFYLRHSSPLGIWTNTDVRLFFVKHMQVMYRPIADTVSNVVGGLGGLLGRTNSQDQVVTRSR